MLKPKKEKVATLPKKKKKGADNRYYERLFAKCKREWSFHSPVKKECANLAREQVGLGYKWWCNTCNGKFAWSEIAFDHIVPIGSTTPKTLEEFLECVKNQNCPLENLQVLCVPCHKLKTKEESRKELKDLFIPFCEKWLNEWGIPFNLLNLDFKDLKRLNSIIIKINDLLEQKKKEIWRKKLVDFIKKHG